ncbi:MAG: hypothetical protein R6U92_05070 [Bacillota bacterium]
MPGRIRCQVGNGLFSLRGGRSPSVTLSCGVTALGKSDIKWREMLRRADATLVRTRPEGKNRIVAIANAEDEPA